MLDRADRPRRGKVLLSSDEMRKIAFRLEQGDTPTEIARDLGRCRQTVHGFAQRRGLVPPTLNPWSLGPGELDPDDPGEVSGDYRVITRAAVIEQDKAFCARLEHAIERGYEKDPRRPA